jgi:hypothetical protein
MDSDDESEFKKFKQDLKLMKENRVGSISISNIRHSIDQRERSYSMANPVPLKFESRNKASFSPKEEAKSPVRSIEILKSINEPEQEPLDKILEINSN